MPRFEAVIPREQCSAPMANQRVSFKKWKTKQADKRRLLDLN